MILSIPTMTPAVSEGKPQFGCVLSPSSSLRHFRFVPWSLLPDSGRRYPCERHLPVLASFWYIVSRTWISCCTSSSLSAIWVASASYRSCVYEPIRSSGDVRQEVKGTPTAPTASHTVSAGGYHQQRMIETAKGRNSFSTSSGSCFTIILYAIPAAITIAEQGSQCHAHL